MTSILGINDVNNFVIYESHLYTAASHSIIVSELNSDKVSLWNPTDGSYAIDKIATDNAGLLCLTEKRLKVSVSFYSLETRQKLSEVTEVATAHVDQLLFSESGSILFVLSSIPSLGVVLFESQGQGKFRKMRSLSLSHLGISRVLLTPSFCSKNAADFFVFSGCTLNGFAELDGFAEFSLSMPSGLDIICILSVSGGVLLASRCGRIFLRQMSGESVEELAHLQCVPVAIRKMSDESIVVCGSNGTISILDMYTREIKSLLSQPNEDFQTITNAVLYHGDIFLGTQSGIFSVSLTDNVEPIVFPIRSTPSSDVVKVLAMDRGKSWVACFSDGSFLTSTIEGQVTQFRNTSDGLFIVDACSVSDGQCIVLLDADGNLRGVNPHTGHELWQCGPSSSPNHPCLRCTCNEHGDIVVSSDQSLFFYNATLKECKNLGIVLAQLKSDIQFAQWMPKGDYFFVVCHSGEIYQLAFPTDGSAETEHTVESLLTGASWWLDFPISTLFFCFSENDVSNILVHSADKDTKLYALERKKDADPTKMLRPYFLMRDHESNGTQLGRLNATTIYSAGKDGKVVLRDISHYQTKLSPIPPSKEKRKPLQIMDVRAFGNGGISSVIPIAESSEGHLLVCAGADSIVHVVSTTAPFMKESWIGSRWTVRKIIPLSGSLDAESNAGSPGNEKPELKRAKLLENMEEIRLKWKEAMREKKPEIPLSALLVPRQIQELEEASEAAIDEMKENEFYHGLYNEYIQDVIKKRCLDSMEVGRCKISSLLTSSFEVHNFHILKESTAKRQVAQKVAFLRSIQLKRDNDRNDSGEKPKRFSNLYENPRESDTETNRPEAESALWKAEDVHTHSRSVMQSILFRHLVLTTKENFNFKFKELAEYKKSVISQINEQTQRCIKILRQLGEPFDEGRLFAYRVDPEEDMSSLFTVTDEELPEEARDLLPKKQDVTIFSPSNEAALKNWMDGLEKDVEVVQVTIKPPEFADESAEAFVPPDERTEEQIRLFEEYEKKLKEETESVNLRRDALHHELNGLQKSIKEAAQSVEERLKQLREQRLVASEQIGRLELQRILVLHHALLNHESVRQFMLLDAQKKDIMRQLNYAKVLLEGKRASANGILNDLEAMEMEYSQYIASAKLQPPFTDPQHGDKLLRRLTRWKNKRDEGKAPMPDKDAPQVEFPPELWEMFCMHCEELESMSIEINQMEAKHREESAAFDDVTAQIDALQHSLDEAASQAGGQSRKFLSKVLDTTTICELHQGQIQDERTNCCSSFATSSLRWTDDVLAYNELILESFGDSTKFLQKIAKREKQLKQSRWETKRLQYCIGTLEMELRHLHTLRVTRQMQEWLSGDAEVSEEKTIAGIEKHKDFVNKSMKKKLDDLVRTTQQLKNQVADRSIENRAIYEQYEDLRGTVDDMSNVKTMVDAHADGAEHFTKRAKEIYETSELEELARSQQEELVRLKFEVDRLRERTFPSFAVVSKRTV